jgi:hypothetical protein
MFTEMFAKFQKGMIEPGNMMDQLKELNEAK